MKESIDPCNDFYEYACGNWEENDSMSSDQLITEQVQYRTYRRLKELLEENYNKIPFIETFQLYYNVCMNENTTEKRKLDSIQHILNMSGGWPIMREKEEWSKGYVTWQIINDYYQEYTIRSFFNTAYKSDTKNPIRNIFVITEYENPKKRMEETRMTIAELQKYYDLVKTQSYTSKINWLNVIQNSFRPLNVSINASEPVLIYNKNFLHKLARLLDATSDYVIANYIQWNFVSRFMIYLNKEMRDIVFKYRYPDYYEQVPRWLICIRNLPLKDLLSYLFVQTYNSENNLKVVSKILYEVKAEMLSRLAWLNNRTKNIIRDKIDNHTSSLISYPEWYRNHTTVTQLLHETRNLLDNDDYFITIIKLLSHRMKTELMDFLNPPNTDKRKYNKLLYVGDSYDLFTIRQDPYFLPNTPFAIKYGAIGMLIGHKLADNLDWHSIIDAKYKEAFEKLKCFAKKYFYYTYYIRPNKKNKHDKPQNREEKNRDITYFISIETAFAAFQKRKAKEPLQLKLPTLNTSEQLFFLTYAHLMCASSRGIYEIYPANIDVISCKSFLSGILANMVSFSNTFNCSMGSRMNPTIKCIV